MKTSQDGDCTIYSALENGNDTDGICTCGYGKEFLRANGSYKEMYSDEKVNTAEMIIPENIVLPLEKVVCQLCGTLTANTKNMIYRCSKIECGKTWYNKGGRIISYQEMIGIEDTNKIKKVHL